jgi:hypothetical protein
MASDDDGDTRDHCSRCGYSECVCGLDPGRIGAYPSRGEGGEPVSKHTCPQCPGCNEAYHVCPVCGATVTH